MYDIQVLPVPMPFECPHLIQIVLVRFPRNYIKQWLGTEPSSYGGANRFIRECCVVIGNLDGLLAPRPGCSISHQLCMAALLQAYKPEHCCFNRASDGKKSVVLQQDSFLIPEGASNVFTLFVCEHDAVE